MSIAVITDSTAYLSQSLAAEHHIHIIPLNVLFNGESLKETELSHRDFYERMQTQQELPTTSQPAVGQYAALLEQLKIQGYRDVIAVHLSSGISGTYQSAVTAGQMVEGIHVHPFDSEVSCMPQGFFALRASEMVDETADKIIAELEAMKQDSRAYFLVDDLKNLQKGGRLSGAQAFIGSMLQVKPILHFEATKIVPFDKVRTKKKAMKRIEQLIHEFIGEEEGTASIIHANDEQVGQAWLKQMEESFPNVTFILSEFGPVIGTHLGEKALGFGIVKRKLSL